MGGTAGLIYSAFMIFKELSTKAKITSVTPTSNCSTVDVDSRNMDSITYLSDRVSEVAKGNDEK